MADDIVGRLRAPQWSCICVDAVLANCSLCNVRLDAADEIERLRAEASALAQDLFFMGAGVDKFAGENYEQYCEIKQLRADLDLYRKALELAMQEESDSSYNLLVLHWLEEARRG